MTRGQIRSLTPLRAVCLLLLTISLSPAQSLQHLLERMDELGPKFSSATASIVCVNHNEVLNQDEKETGTIAVKRYPSGKMRYRAVITSPEPYQIALRDETAERFMPMANLIQVFDLKRFRDIAQTFLTLGFGMTGRQLTANFDIAATGSTLELIPRTADIRRQVPKIEIWISEENGCPMRQKFYFPGKDYRLVTYTDLKFNPKLADADLELPKGAKRERVN